jgi:hypothetical protein
MFLRRTRYANHGHAFPVDALGDALTLDTDEIEDGMWVTKEEAIAALKGDFHRAPPLKQDRNVVPRKPPGNSSAQLRSA